MQNNGIAWNKFSVHIDHAKWRGLKNSVLSPLKKEIVLHA